MIIESRHLAIGRRATYPAYNGNVNEEDETGSNASDEVDVVADSAFYR